MEDPAALNGSVSEMDDDGVVPAEEIPPYTGCPLTAVCLPKAHRQLF